MSSWHTRSNADVEERTSPVAYYRYLDDDRESGVDDLQLWSAVQGLEAVGAEHIYVLDENIFKDYGNYRLKFSPKVTVFEHHDGQVDPETSERQLESVSEHLDADGRLRSIPADHPAVELCRDMLESTGVPVSISGDRVYLSPASSNTVQKEGSSVSALLSRLHDPTAAQFYKGKIVMIDRGILEATLLQVPTPNEVLTIGGVYSQLLRSMAFGFNLQAPGTSVDRLIFLCLVGGFCWLSSGLQPTRVAALGGGGLAVVFVLWYCSIPAGLKLPIFKYLIALLASILLMTFFEMRRSRAILQSFGGAEDAAFEGEESDASMVFTNIPPFLMEMERTGNENLLAYRRDYNEILAVIARRYHGKVLDYQGDAQMLGFGLRYDDDRDHAAEATSAAIEIVESVKSLAERWQVPPEKLQVNAGVCTGSIALGHLGAAQKQDIAAIGDTTNTAARLMGAAMKQKLPVLIAKSTFVYAEGLIQGEQLAPVELKGKSAPVEVYGHVKVDAQWQKENRTKTKGSMSSSGGTLTYKGDNRSNLALSVIAGAIAIVVTCGLWKQNAFVQPEKYVRDAAHLKFGLTPADPSIVIVGIDEASITDHRLGRFPWSRGVYAQIVKNLKNSGYKGMFIDVMFKSDREDDPEGDRAFAEAIAADPRVVVAAVLSRNEHYRLDKPILFSALDIEQAADSFQLGLIHAATETDDIARDGFLSARETASHSTREADQRTMYPFAAPALLIHEGDRFELAGDTLFLGKKAVPVRVQDRAQGTTSVSIRFGPSATADGLPPSSGSYQVISAIRLVDPSDPIFKELDGKYLLMGQTLTTGRENEIDRIDTVVGKLKGVEVHARLLDNLLNDNFFRPEDAVLEVIKIIVTGIFTIYILTVFRNPREYLLGLLGVLVVDVVLYLVIYLLLGRLTELLPSVASVIFVSAFVLLGRYLLTYRALTMVIPAEVASELLYHNSVRDRRQIATILLTDIRGYTTLSEGRSAVAMLDVLNEYHKRTVACYDRYGGQALTYQGDAQIVVFGVFGNRKNPAADAAQAALGLQAICDQLRAEWGIEKREDFDVGAGLCTGEIEVGLLGGQTNLQYSVVGETVRKAHKVQSMSTDLDAAVIMDEETFLAAEGKIDSDDLGMVQPAGLSHPIKLYRAKSVHQD